MTKTTKPFTTDGSHAVHLPAEFRFDAPEVYVRRDEVTGDVILSPHPPTSWAEFMNLRTELGALDDNFLSNRR